MIIAIIKHKKFTGVGPANGYPAGQTAHIFDTYDQAKTYVMLVEKLAMFDGARIFDGEEDIEDHRKARR